MSDDVQLTQKGPGIEKIKADLLALSKMDVLVGIPQEESSRQGETINNAELIYIHTHGIRKRAMINEMQPALDAGTPYSAAHQMYIQAHGSPLWHSPPRPVIEPAIEKNKEILAEKLKLPAQSAMAGDLAKAQRELAIAGGVAVNLVQDFFDDPTNGWAPNSPATIKAKGSDKPLVDTDDMRKSITYVVRDKK